MFLAATREPPQLSLPSCPHRSFRGVPVASFFAPFFAENEQRADRPAGPRLFGVEANEVDRTATLQRKLRHAVAQTWMISTAAVLVAAIPIEHARGGELMDCEPQRVRGDGRHWAYRIIDGRQCWYPGQRGKPKDELRWSEAPSATQDSSALEQPDVEARAPAQAPQSRGVVEQAEVEATLPEPPAASPEPDINKVMPEEWRAAAADQLLAFTCCWPELPTASRVPQPGPGGRRDQPLAWPLILLPLEFSARCGQKGSGGCFRPVSAGQQSPPGGARGNSRSAKALTM